MRFEVVEEALQAVLGFGAQVEVLEPVDLRRQVSEQVETLRRLYQSDYAEK